MSNQSAQKKNLKKVGHETETLKTTAGIYAAMVAIRKIQLYSRWKKYRLIFFPFNFYNF